MSGPKTVNKIAAILKLKEENVSEIINYAKDNGTILDTGRLEVKDMHDVFAGFENLKVYELNWFKIISSKKEYV